MDTPPEPAPRRPAPRPLSPRPTPPRPKRDYAAEEEYGRRLNAAHSQLRRGLISEAEASAQALLTDQPAEAGALELLGDIEEARGNWDAAIAAYQAARAKEPGRASAEAKIGKAVLRRAEQQRQKNAGRGLRRRRHVSGAPHGRRAQRLAGDSGIGALSGPGADCPGPDGQRRGDGRHFCAGPGSSGPASARQTRQLSVQPGVLADLGASDQRLDLCRRRCVRDFLAVVAPIQKSSETFAEFVTPIVKQS